MVDALHEIFSGNIYKTFKTLNKLTEEHEKISSANDSRMRRNIRSFIEDIQFDSVFPSVGRGFKWLFGTATVAQMKFNNDRIKQQLEWDENTNKILSQVAIQLEQQAEEAKHVVENVNILNDYVNSLNNKVLNNEREYHMINQLILLAIRVCRYVDILSSSAAEYGLAMKTNKVSPNMLPPSSVLKLFEEANKQYHLNPIVLKKYKLDATSGEKMSDALNTFYTTATAVPIGGYIFIRVLFEKPEYYNGDDDDDDDDDDDMPRIQSNIFDAYHIQPFYKVKNDTFFKAKVDYEGSLVVMVEGNYISTIKLNKLLLECDQVTPRIFVCDPHVIPLIPTAIISNEHPSKLTCSYRLIYRHLANLVAKGKLVASPLTPPSTITSSEAPTTDSPLSGFYPRSNWHIQFSDNQGNSNKVERVKWSSGDHHKDHKTWTSKDDTYCELTVDVEGNGASPEKDMRYTEMSDHHYIFLTEGTKLSFKAVCPTRIIKIGNKTKVLSVIIKSLPPHLSAVKISSICDVYTSVAKISGVNKPIKAYAIDDNRENRVQEINRIMTYSIKPMYNKLSITPKLALLSPNMIKEMKYSPWQKHLKTSIEANEIKLKKMENQKMELGQSVFMVICTISVVIALVLVFIIIFCCCKT